VAGILGLSAALQQQVFGGLNEKQMASLSGIEESGKHLLTLINDILDLSKIEAGKDEMLVEVVKVSEICQAALWMVEQDARRKNLKVSFSQDVMVTISRQTRDA